nr:MAG TPA: hypothetical protein [Caudoviricetes sp.]
MLPTQKTLNRYRQLKLSLYPTQIQYTISCR